MIKPFVLILTVLLLSACGAQPVKDVSDIGAADARKLELNAKRIALENLTAFRVMGGLGIWTEKESIATRVDWRQLNTNDFNVLVRLPAGISSARVVKQSGVSSVQIGSAEPVKGESASQLLQQSLGLSVAVPLEQLSLWIKGLPGDQAELVTYDEQNRLLTMSYRDTEGTLWRAKVLKYTSFEKLQVPALIIAKGGPYNLRLILKQWSALPADSNLSLATEQSSTPPKKASSRLKVPGR